MSQDILERVMQSPRLPSLPTVAIEVIELVQRSDVDIRQIAETISHDPALTSKILKTVNSSFYGQSHEISTISHALVVLGLNSIKTLALGFHLVGNLKQSGDGEGFDHLTFWRRSLFSAVAARTLSSKCGIVQQEEAFLGGLLQDLGMLAMSQTLDDEYLDLLDESANDHLLLVEKERAKYDIDHAEVGAKLAESWKLPKLLVATIRYHEDPTGAPEELAAFVRTVALGNRIADVFILEQSGEALDRVYGLAEEWFGLDRETAGPLFTEIHKNTVEMKRLFDLPTGPLGDPQAILASAHDALMHVTMQHDQQTMRLQEQNKQLRQKATTDSLTGVANRGHFNDRIAAAFDKANSDEPLSLLFLDTDRFKEFNDTYGHPTGDRVLIKKAQVLTEASPQNALVARYGGEEFAVVLPGVDRVDAAKLAEQIREAIAAAQVESDEGEPLSITASIGVATHDGSFFTNVSQLVKAADQGVYAAKRAGRNCVRIFAPRTQRAAG